jgi:hypothetical protein
MKKPFFHSLSVLLLLAQSCILAIAQNPDTTQHISSWVLKENYTLPEEQTVDSSLFLFQRYQPSYKKSFGNTSLGNFGSPVVPNIYIFRNYYTDFPQAQPYETYMNLPENCLYFQTKSPFTHLFYISGGSKENLQQSIKVLHTQNVTRRLNVGFTFDLRSSLGQYIAQKTTNNSFSFFSSYLGERYSMHTNLNIHRFTMLENGGITSDRMITDTTVVPKAVPVAFAQSDNASSLLKNTSFLLHQQLALLNHKTGREKGDSLSQKGESRGLLVLGHTFLYESYVKHYKDYRVDSTALNFAYTSDSAYYRRIENTLYLNITPFDKKSSNLSGFVYVSNELRRYSYSSPIQSDTTGVSSRNYNFHNNAVGFILSGRLKSKFDWLFNGKYYLTGLYAGNELLDGKLTKGFGPDSALTSRLTFFGKFESQNPSFFYQTYYANRYSWENTFNPEVTTQIGGEIQWVKYKLRGTFYNTLVGQYVYLDSSATGISPKQAKDPINISTAILSKDFHFWKFYLLNDVVYQWTTSEAAIRLPKWSLHNTTFFEQALFKKVLLVQLGFDVYYHSRYRIDAYSPELGMFYNQKGSTLVGDYPYVDAFMNLKLKRARFFVKYEHVNSGLFNHDYFEALHYPLGTRMLKMGISWIFYD